MNQTSQLLYVNVFDKVKNFPFCMCIFHVKIMYIFSALYDICYTQIYSTGLNNSSFRPVMFLFQQNNFQWKVDSCVFGLTELQTTGVI